MMEGRRKAAFFGCLNRRGAEGAEDFSVVLYYLTNTVQLVVI